MPGAALKCHICGSTLTIATDEGFVCRECGAAQTAVRNDAVEDEFDIVGGRTAFMTLPTVLEDDREEAKQNRYEAIQDLLQLMTTHAAAMAGMGRSQAGNAVLTVWLEYVHFREGIDERVREQTLPRQTEKRRQQPEQKQGMLPKDLKFNQLRVLPQLSQAVLLALLWSGLATAGAIVMPADLVRWLHAGQLGVTPPAIQEALRGLLRQRARRGYRKSTGEWHLHDPGLVTVRAVESTVRRLHSLGIDHSCMDTFHLVPRLTAIAGVRSERTSLEVGELASLYLARAMVWREGDEESEGSEMEGPSSRLSTCIGLSFLGYAAELVAAAAVLLALNDLELLRGCGRGHRHGRPFDSQHYEELTSAEKELFWQCCDDAARRGNFNDSSCWWGTAALLESAPRDAVMAGSVEEAAEDSKAQDPALATQGPEPPVTRPGAPGLPAGEQGALVQPLPEAGPPGPSVAAKPWKREVLQAMLFWLKGELKGGSCDTWCAEALRCEHDLRVWSERFDAGGQEVEDESAESCVEVLEESEFESCAESSDESDSLADLFVLRRHPESRAKARARSEPKAKAGARSQSKAKKRARSESKAQGGAGSSEETESLTGSSEEARSCAGSSEEADWLDGIVDSKACSDSKSKCSELKSNGSMERSGESSWSDDNSEERLKSTTSRLPLKEPEPKRPKKRPRS